MDASGFCSSVSLIFYTITVVFPEPAAAETRMFWFLASMAVCWETLYFGMGNPSGTLKIQTELYHKLHRNKRQHHH